MDECPLQSVIDNLKSNIRDHQHQIQINQKQIEAIRAGKFEYCVRFSIMWATLAGTRIVYEGRGQNKDLTLARASAKNDLIEKLKGNYPLKPHYEELITLEFEEHLPIYVKQNFPKSF